MGRRFTQQEKDFVIEKLTAGWMLKQIAAELDRPLPSIANIRNTHGRHIQLVEHRGGARGTSINRELLTDGVYAGKSDKEIAAELGCSPRTVCDIRLYELGIRRNKRRTPKARRCPQTLKHLERFTVSIPFQERLACVNDLIADYDEQWDKLIASRCGVLLRSVQIQRTARRL